MGQGVWQRRRARLAATVGMAVVVVAREECAAQRFEKGRAAMTQAQVVKGFGHEFE